jgi:hypothetical protein
MKRYGILLAIGLVLVTNVWVIAGVVYNRSGDPEAMITLTEREVPKFRQSRENTGLFLRLKWSMPGYQIPGRFDPEPNWLGHKQLEELGFRTDFPVTASNAYDYYRHQLPRPAYIVLEMEGPAWKEWKQKATAHLHKLRADLAQATDAGKKKTLKRQIEDMKQRLVKQSRLFAVDGGSDAEALRAKYPDRTRYIIAQGIVRIRLDYSFPRNDPARDKRRPFLSGYIQKISVNILHIPHLYRERFLQLTSKPRYISFTGPEGIAKKVQAPRYAITLNYGKKYEPWIADLKALK